MITIGILNSGDSDKECKNYIEKLLKPNLHYFKKFRIIYYDIPGFDVTGEYRHSISVQRQRRIHLAKLRNYLLKTMFSNQDYVLWIDFDIFHYSPNIVKQLVKFDKDIIVPSCVIEYNGRNYDLNTWQLTSELNETLSKLGEDDPFFQGYRSFGRFPDQMKKENSSEDSLEEVHGIGGTMILIKKVVIEKGILFPDYMYHLSSY